MATKIVWKCTNCEHTGEITKPFIAEEKYEEAVHESHKFHCPECKTPALWHKEVES